MKHPPYPLRPNKAVDRLALVDSIRRLDRLKGGLADYTYFGLGGPYLEDFRLLYESYPELGMVSLEEDPETLKWQKFHRPCSTLKLRESTVDSFVSSYEAKDEKSIFWLDYTGLEFSNIEDFMMLLEKVALDSMVKISLRANPGDYNDRKKREEFKRRFAALMPDPSANPPRRQKPFADLIQRMLRIAGQKALPAGVDRTFQPVSSFFYADGAGMYTLTGIVCSEDSTSETKKGFKDAPFANLNWATPHEIDVPNRRSSSDSQADR